MSVQRIQVELARALQVFAFVELHPTGDGGVFVKAALQTSARVTYFVEIRFDNYPMMAPKVFVVSPALHPSTKNFHRYPDGNLCLLHPNMWNPGVHDLTFVLGRTAKWLNKYEVWRENGRWPGASIAH